MRSRIQLPLALALALALGGCRGGETELPVAGELELCCKAAGQDNVSFSGCRVTSFCRANESVWVRGPLSCSATTSDQCAGGRCCELDLARAPSTLAPDPSPLALNPIPVDWQGTPTPVYVPNFVCPASVERGVSGTVLLHVTVDETGRVTDVTIHRSLLPECDALARDALLHAEFEPALTPVGKPVAARMIWAYQFATDKR
jgi:TonB family protein